jgi:formylglycine-generating enzyme required for sulfatase activity
MRSFRDIECGPELVEIDIGSFVRGSDAAIADMYIDETPAVPVSIDYQFAVGKYPVTFREFLPYVEEVLPDSRMVVFIKEHASNAQRLPVVMVSWYEACAYCEWLSAMTGQDYRLLTETEWEYICRAGSQTQYWWGDVFDQRAANNSHRPLRLSDLRDGSLGLSDLRKPESFAEARDQIKRLTAVDRYGPNPWGIFDVHGNTWEWVQDIYKDSRTNPSKWAPADKEPFRSTRGGSWMDPPLSLRSAVRSWAAPSLRDRIIGFRVARSM